MQLMANDTRLLRLKLTQNGIRVVDQQENKKNIANEISRGP